MRARTLSATLGFIALVITTSSVPATGADADAGQETGPLIARHATLTVHDAGYPNADLPEVQIETATVSQDLVGARIRASVTLRGEPAPTATQEVGVGFGQDTNGTCKIAHVEKTPAGTPTDGASRVGTVVTFDRPVPSAAVADWNCAAAVVMAGYNAFDVVSGPLVPEYGPPPAPALDVEGVSLLRSEVSRLRLVRGVWTTLDVEVTNTAAATAEAAGLLVTGSGRGLKVRPSTTLPYALSPGSTTSMTVQVKLTSKKKPGALALVAQSGAASAQQSIPVKKAKPAKRPVAGKYKVRKSKVGFRIKGRTVVKFRTGKLRTRCGGAPDPFTYQSSAYRFPKAKIGRDGIVNATKRTDDYVVNLQMKVVGTKVRRGYFSYYGPDRCFASVEFTAKRK